MSEISIESKDNKKLPNGAEIISKECRISIKEIENGFITRKSWDITYTVNGSSNREYFYCTKEYYSEKNPVTINTPKTGKKDKNIIDLLEDF